METRVNKQMKTGLCLERLRHDECGSVIAISAAIIFVSFAVAALVVDGAYLYFVKSRLQAVADISAVAAIQEISNTNTMNAVIDRIVTANMPADENGVVVSKADVILGRWNDEGKQFVPNRHAPDSIKVVARRSSGNDNPVQTRFAQIFGSGQFDIEITSIASIRPKLPVCLLALNSSASRALAITGSGSVQSQDCVVYSNSSAADSVYLTKGATCRPHTLVLLEP